MGNYESPKEKQQIFLDYGFFEINFVGRYILIGISVLSFIPYITFIVGTFLRLRRTGTFTISMKLQFMICCVCCILGICSFFPNHVPSENAPEQGTINQTEIIIEERNKKSCHIEASLRSSALLSTGVLSLLSTIYNLIMYTKPDIIEKNKLVHNLIIFVIPLVLVIFSFVISLIFSQPRIGFFGFCKYRVVDFPDLLLLMLTVFGWFCCLVLQVILMYIVIKSHRAESSKQDESDPRMLLLAKKMEFRAYCCLFDYILIFTCGTASYNHIAYKRNLIWVFEIIAHLLWPVHILIFGFIGTDLFLEIGQQCNCLKVEMPDISSNQEQIRELIGRDSFISQNEEVL